MGGYPTLAARFAYPARAVRPHWAVNAFLFLLPFGLLVEFEIIGRLFLADIITLAAFPIVFLARRRPFDSLTRRLVLLLCLWFAGQILTDIMRATPFNDLARGWSKIGLSLINFIMLAILVDSSTDRVRALLAGIGAAMLLDPIMLYAPDNPWMLWKMGGVSGLVTFLLACVSGASAQRFRLSLLILALGGGLALLYNARAAALFCFVPIVFLLVASKQKTIAQARRCRFALLMYIIPLALGTASIFLVYETYSYVAVAGWLGQEAQEKFYLQAGDKGLFNLLACGRIEWTASLQAITDSPFIGHGSWARDMTYRYGMSQVLQQLSCPIIEYELILDDTIPTHSLLFGAWVEAGLLGAVFWGGVFYTVAAFLNNAIRQSHVLMPLLVFLAISLLWDIVFSPFGASRRLTVMAILVALLQAMRQFSSRMARKPA